MCVYIVILRTDMIVALEDQPTGLVLQKNKLGFIKYYPRTHIEILIYDSIFCFIMLIYKTLSEILIFRVFPKCIRL